MSTESTDKSSSETTIEVEGIRPIDSFDISMTSPTTSDEVRVSRFDGTNKVGTPWPNEWDRFRVTYGGRWDDPELELLTEFGMPENAEMAAILFPGKAFGYPNYKAEMLGILGNYPLTVKEGAKLTIHTPVQLDMYVWRIRLFLRQYHTFQEELWCVHRELWMRRVLNAPGIEDGSAVYYELAKGITFLRLVFKYITYPVGGPNNVKYNYSVQEKKALHCRYREIIREYESICKTKGKLIRLHSPDRVKTMIEEGFAILQIPSHIIDRLLDDSCKPSERSARPLALEHAAKDTLKGYEPWKHKEDELLYLEREGKKLSKNKEGSGSEIQS